MTGPADLPPIAADAADRRDGLDVETTRRLDAWLVALDRRHRQPLRPADFNKAVRALSARYVERRRELEGRSPIDSAGKRAAFAGFYAPLHALTVLQIVTPLIGPDRAESGSTILDLGCGTGVSSAAVALVTGGSIVGIDRDAWTIAEAQWNWRTLGLRGRTIRGDLVAAAGDVRGATASRGRPFVVAGWSVNELPTSARARLLPALVRHTADGGRLLVIEPLSKRVTPWWDSWRDALAPHGVHAREWQFDTALPPALAETARATGLDPSLRARTLTTG